MSHTRSNVKMKAGYNEETSKIKPLCMDQLQEKQLRQVRKPQALTNKTITNKIN